MDQSISKKYKDFQSEILSKRGQSLLEVLVAVTIAFIMISGASALIGVSLHGTKVNRFAQEGNFLAEDMLSKLISYSENKWYCPPNCSGNFGIYNLNKGSLNTYYLSTSTSEISWVSGSETITLGNINYVRHFYIENVSRDVNGNIDSSYSPSSEDPSTQKITIIISWSGTPSTGNTSISKYIFRKSNVVFNQTDWSGGSTDPNDFSYTSQSSNKFFNATDIQYSARGEINIQ